MVANHRGGSESSMDATTVFLTQSGYNHVALLRWQEFATWSVAVFCLTYHRGVGASGGCSMHHALWVNHLSQIVRPGPRLIFVPSGIVIHPAV